MAVPRERGGISKGTWMMKLNKERHECHHYAQDAHGQVGLAQEGVLASKEGAGGQHQALAALERVAVVHVLNSHLEHLPCVQVLVDAAIQLTELRHERRSHPHHEVLVLAQGNRGIQACTAYRIARTFPPLINVIRKVSREDFA